MTDFRVAITCDKYAESQIDVELDWDADKGIWSRSEKEWGLGQGWMQGLNPEANDLEELGKFFHVDLTNIPHETLQRLSPAELVMLHRNSTSPPTVLALLCSECRKHWIVFKWNPDQNTWFVYGRTCEFSWRRGEPPESSQLEVLEAILGS
jgi:hypothetical protein